MRYKREGDIILISRNKRHILKKVKEGWKNGYGCPVCDLFEVCLDWGKGKSMCEKMAKSGIITKLYYENKKLYFINIR